MRWNFLYTNYSWLHNPWLGGYRPQIPVLSVLCHQLNSLNPPRTKFLGTPLGRWVCLGLLHQLGPNFDSVWESSGVNINTCNRHGRPLLPSLIFHYPELHKVTFTNSEQPKDLSNVCPTAVGHFSKCSVSAVCRCLQQPQPIFNPPPHDRHFCTWRLRVVSSAAGSTDVVLLSVQQQEIQQCQVRQCRGPFSRASTPLPTIRHIFIQVWRHFIMDMRRCTGWLMDRLWPWPSA